MKHSDFVHLHVHTQYSLLDGACKVSELIDQAIAYKMPAVAMTDHGNMFGAIDFYTKALKKGIKPIIGAEVYVAPDSRFEKSARGIKDAAYHLVLLVKDEQGYKNLMKIVSIGYLEGFYYRPRVDKEILAKFNDGLIATSACLKGEIAHLILSGDIEKARRTADEYNRIFGKGNFYIEIQDNGIEEQTQANKELIKLARDLDIPLVATNDVHYILQEDSKAHEALLCVQTQTTLDDPNRMKMATNEFYFKSPDQMKAAFSKSAPDAIKNTIEITEKCNLELDFSAAHMPSIPLPQGHTIKSYLRELVEKGLIQRYGQVNDQLRQRVEHELKTIEDSGYPSYFLIVWDFVQYARSKNIPVGPGRGSAAGSVVSYALGITDLDPLKYDLLFERFLNPERVSMPDIDIDFCYTRRQEVIDYVVQRYSKDNVAQIITFGTLQARAVVRDVGRVLGLPYSDVDKIAKLIPQEIKITLDRALATVPELKDLYRTDANIKQLINIARKLEGLNRHAGTHAAGIVITDKPLDLYVPLFKPTGESMISTGYAMKSLETIKLLKMDFLGLKTLTVIDQTIKIIKKIKNIDVDIDKIPLDDHKTFQLLCNAQSTGVFQLESSGMKDLLKKVQPEKFEEIISLIALYRPGPINSGMLDDFVKRKHGEVKVVYDHPLLEPILKDTYGVIVYQEQVMRIASVLAGFSLAQADNLRRAMGKKIVEIMSKARNDFVEGAQKNNIDPKLSGKIYDMIEMFAEYGFNKSHSAAYAMISYRTAYLKANFPSEFMTALLICEDSTDKVTVYITEALRMKIKILPPDINESFANFTLVNNNIRFGLGAVKNVGQTAVDSIINAREKVKEFKSLYAFTEHVDTRTVNRKVIESLIKCGAFGATGLYRSQLIAILDNALDVAGSIQKDRNSGQMSFFGAFDAEENFKNTFQEVPDIPEWQESQLLTYEKELLGFYITSHPLSRYEKVIRTYSTSSLDKLSSLRDGEEILVGGIMNKVRTTVTKSKGEKMAIVTFEDLSGTCDVLVFPRTYEKVASLVSNDAIVFIKGTANLKEETPKIIANDIIVPEDVKEKFTKAILVNISTTGLDDYLLDSFKKLLDKHKGNVPTFINFVEPSGKRTRVALGSEYFVSANEALIDDIDGLLGDGSVNFVVRL